MNALTRRTLLRASAASAALVAPAALAGPMLDASAPDPLMALGERQAEVLRRIEIENAIGKRIYQTLSDDARGGWPKIDRAEPLWRDYPPYAPDASAICDRPSLLDIRRVTRELVDAAAGDSAAVAAAHEMGRARMRSLVTRRRAGRREEDASGYPAHVARFEALYDELDEVEGQIGAAIPTTLPGALVKLRMAVRWIIVFSTCLEGEEVDYEGMEPEKRVTIDVLRDLERLTGGAA